jgi:hypothetical protein
VACQQKSSTTMRAVRHGIDMTLVLYEMWDSTAWDWRPSSTTVLEGARSTQASVTGKLCSLKYDLSRYWLLVGDQRAGRCQYVGRHDLLDHNTEESNEAILDGYWVLSLMPSGFLSHLTKLFQVTKLNSVGHALIFLSWICTAMLPKNATKHFQISLHTQWILTCFGQTCDRLQEDKIQRSETLNVENEISKISEPIKICNYKQT